jgi:ASC-1-like (ASCH) protein
MKQHHMKLSSEPFNAIAGGTKTLEIRLYDTKRRRVEVGDVIVFSHTSMELRTVVVGLSRFATFSDLFSALGGVSAGWSASDSRDSMVATMRMYYSEEEEQKYGVVGIHLTLI